MSDIRRWLEDLGLDQYAAAFESNDIDMALLPQVDDQALKDIGVASAGHRLRLRAAIKRLDEAPALTESGPTQEAGAAIEPASAERRQLTVMFCDLVGSTELSRTLDPEALRELMEVYQRTCGAVVNRYAGHVAQYLGDGLMVYFGWPRAHEDDAERAVRTGLDIVDAVQRIAAPAPLRVRIGIATGPVVVGETGKGDASVPKVAVGETPNLAARVQGLAQPGHIIIGPGTRHLLGTTFEYVDLGAHTLKGIEEPVHAWRVAAVAQAEGRFEVQRAGELTSFVGREDEIGLLMRRWEQAKNGEGQVVLLSGEAGIGKSRMLRELRTRIVGEPHTRLRYQCSPFHAQSALHPVIEQFERAAGFAREDSPAQKLGKTEALLRQALPLQRAADVLPLFVAMLSLPLERPAPPVVYAPQKQKELTLQALMEQVSALSTRQPILMQFEDVHWIDPTSQEVLDLLIDRISQLAVLLLITCRPEYTSRWSGEPHVSTLTMSRLNRRLGAELAGRAFGGKAIPPELLEQIVAKTDGVPLFVEELAKAVLDGGLVRLGDNGYELTGPLSALAIPSTLQDSLMARLDRLAEVREVAQIGACIGREFPHDLLACTSPLPEPKLQAALARLADADLISWRGKAQDAIYSFKHALVRDAAYASLLKSRRAVLHRAIAEALETRFAPQVAASPEVVAHHYTEAGLADKAVGYWLQAGHRAIDRFANIEAAGHLSAGLRVLQALPEGIERDRTELALQAGLGTAIGTSKGFSPPEVGRAFERARELSERVGSVPNKLLILFGVCVYYLMRGDYETGQAVGTQILALAPDAEEPDPVVVLGQACVSGSLTFKGKIEQAFREAGIGSRAYQASGPVPLGRVFGFDPGVICFEWEAWSLLMMGYADQAARAYVLAETYAAADGHPLTVATTRAHCTAFHALRADPSAAREHAMRAVAFCKEHDILIRQVEAQIVQGWAIAESGDPTGGVPEIEAALATWRHLGAQVLDSFWYLLLAKAYACAGRLPDARGALETAFKAANDHDEHMVAPELHRLDGELWLASANAQDKAEQSFQKAIAMAIDQKSRLWQLRATTSLGRLWESRGKRVEARGLLAPIHDWFTEGLESKDLVEARVLLDSLR